MAKKNSLEGLIADLDFLAKNFDYLLEQKYNDIIAQIFVQIGKSTAYDTGVARDLVKKVLRGLNRPDLENELEHQVYEFWNTKAQRESQGARVNLVKIRGRYKIIIEDDGFTAQAEDGKVSFIHPRNNPLVIPNHVDYALDGFEAGTNSSIELAINQLELTIVKLIEEGL